MRDSVVIVLCVSIRWIEVARGARATGTGASGFGYGTSTVVWAFGRLKVS